MVLGSLSALTVSQVDESPGSSLSGSQLFERYVPVLCWSFFTTTYTDANDFGPSVSRALWFRVFLPAVMAHSQVWSPPFTRSLCFCFLSLRLQLSFKGYKKLTFRPLCLLQVWPSTVSLAMAFIDCVASFRVVLLLFSYLH